MHSASLPLSHPGEDLPGGSVKAQIDWLSSRWASRQMDGISVIRRRHGRRRAWTVACHACAVVFASSHLPAGSRVHRGGSSGPARGGCGG